MGRVDGTPQCLVRIANQELCGGFAKASSTQVWDDRAAKIRRKTDLGTLFAPLSFPAVQTGMTRAEGSPGGGNGSRT